MANLKLTEKEVQEAQSALTEWFKSQNITPVDGARVMCSIIAEQLVFKTKDIDKLQAAIRGTSELLTLNVVAYIRGFK